MQFWNQLLFYNITFNRKISQTYIIFWWKILSTIVVETWKLISIANSYNNLKSTPTQSSHNSSKPNWYIHSKDDKMYYLSNEYMEDYWKKVLIIYLIKIIKLTYIK